MPAERNVKIAYLTGQYPKTSHTFIRREIAGLEEAGLEVDRISVRPAAGLVDERDRDEQARTRVLLRRGALGLLPGALAVTARRPLRTLSALRTALAMGWKSPRGLLRHLAYLAEACVLLRWLERSGAEHVHAHFATNAADVALLCRELGGPPFSFTAHGTADLGSRAVLSLTRKISAAAFAVAVCEDGRQRLLLRTSPGHEGKIHVVRCGVDGQFLAADAQPVPSARRLTCVARLSQEKGIAVLLHATRLLAEEGVDFELSLLGDGDERAGLEGLARDLGIADRVHFEGWKGGALVREGILESRALVLPSFSEGLPVVIMEALALRRPVICTAVGGISELVEAGVSGWIVPPGSERALADAMRDALARPTEELDAMGQRGAERVAASHDSSAQARSMAQLFLGARARSNGSSTASHE